MIEDDIRRFIVEELNGPPQQLTSDFPLIERSVIDSLGIFQLVGFIESEYGIQIDDEELVPEHFGTIGDIARLVSSKRDTQVS